MNSENVAEETAEIIATRNAEFKMKVEKEVGFIVATFINDLYKVNTPERNFFIRDIENYSAQSGLLRGLLIK